MRRALPRLQLAITAVLLTALPAISSLAQTPAAAASGPASTAGPADPAPLEPEGRPTGDPSSAADRTAQLPAGWRASRDRVWTVRGDDTGLHLLVADQSDAYAWRTVTTLREPGIETDAWIGHACLTESGRRAVVTYAPRAWVNDGSTFLRGGFSAVVDMASGAVTKLGVRTSLAYFSPGCGAGEKAVLTQSRFTEESGASQTRMVVVDAERGAVVSTLQRAGQLTSALPTPVGVVAARGHQIVRVPASGRLEALVSTPSVASFLTVDADGGLVYLAGTEERNAVSRLPLSAARNRRQSTARPQHLVTSRGTWLGIEGAPAGRVFVTGGRGDQARALGHGVRRIPATVRADVSTTGAAVVDPDPRVAPVSAEASSSPEISSEETAETTEPGEATAVDLRVRLLTSGEELDFTVDPGVRPARRYLEGRAAHAELATPSVPSPGPQSLAGTRVTGSIDTDASCAVPRNDPHNQVLQPTARQVEWAVSQAIVNNLQTARPTNWKQSGLASWTPQQMFPSQPLVGGGRVPAQVLLGILAQESNLWQASYHAKPGVMGNPLVGNFYGRDIYSGDDEQVDPWLIRYSEADCGYGVGQVTDGMRKAGHARPGEVLMTPTQQRAVALDYQTNIAKALTILQDKWNQTTAAGLVHDDGDPSALENWTFAVWAYNSGFYPNKGDGSPWGVGWLNNPANPVYRPNRELFNKYPTDPVTPNEWPYQERVIGWAAYPIATPDGAGYRAAWWVNEVARANAQPPNHTFCTPQDNECNPGQQYQPTAPEVSGAPPGPCAHRNAQGQYDLKCWWHSPTTYNNCGAGYCGHELKRFNTTYPEQPDGTYYPPVCTLAGLPSNAWIVDDVPASAPSARPGCGHPWTDRGTFTMSLASDSARVDLHQIGAGFGGHFWFNHSRRAETEGGRLEATGTWTFDTSLSQWARVLVHMPDHGAHTQQAAYTIHLGNGVTKTRHALQRTRANRWVSLGVVKFAGIPKISLSSDTYDGTGSDDVAWDAVAIEPLPKKPAHFVVALGDSYSSGEGASGPEGVDYYRETDVLGNLGDSEGRNACHRSRLAWPRKTVLNDSASTLGSRSDSWDDTLDFQFHACSGAQTENILPYHSVPSGQSKPANLFGETGRGQYGELSQMDKGYLDDNTTLVLLSMGGNDARFSDVIKECIYGAGLQACPDTELSGESEDMDVTVPRDINGRVRRSLEVMIYEIADRAPNAKIVLMGYPKLLENDGACIPGIGTAEGPWINDMSQVMADMTENLVGTSEYGLRAAGYQVWHADPIAEFAGEAICGDPETIHGIVASKTEGDPPGIVPPSAQSFHPKPAGTDHYRDALQEVLRRPDVALGP